MGRGAGPPQRPPQPVAAANSVAPEDPAPLWPDFDGGLFVGGGVSRTNLTPVSVGDETYTFDALLGAKWVHRSGFTFEGAATAQLYVLPYAAAFSPSARVGVGWSF